MATTSWSSVTNNNSDAGYQQWRDEFITQLGVLVTAGVLAADETNITPGAGSRPAIDTEGHYAVYHLSDPLHSTAPVYFRFGFGSAAALVERRLQVACGTATNGSGVISGQGHASVTPHWVNSGTGYPGTPIPSYMSAGEGWFGFNYKIGTTSVLDEALYLFCRTADNTGAPTATGAVIARANNSATFSGVDNLTVYGVRYAATAATVSAACPAAFLPSGQAGNTGGDVRLATIWAATPLPTPAFAFVGARNADVGIGATFSAAVLGASARTFIGLSATRFVDATSQMKPCMLWE